MQIYIFANTGTEVELEQKFASRIKNFNKNRNLNIFYILAYYMHSMHIWIFKFHMNA